MTPQDQWILQKERVLAWLRVGFAIVAVGRHSTQSRKSREIPTAFLCFFGIFLDL